MYTCFQNTRNSSCGNRCGGCCQNTCGQNYTRNTCHHSYCLQNRCDWGLGGLSNTNGGFVNTNCNTVNTNCNTVNTNGVGFCPRYLTFPVSGTAYVPTSAIYFCANSVGTTGTSNGSVNTNGGCGGTHCCGFGRCGGLRAYSNYNDAYYARQYGLDED